MHEYEEAALIPGGQEDKAKLISLLLMRAEVGEVFRKIPYIQKILEQTTVRMFTYEEGERLLIDGQAHPEEKRICICESIITRKNEDYWKMVYLHELTHIILNSGEHSEEFHRLLDGLIDLYNTETGSSLENDCEYFED